jgi:hypothetical protein
VSEGIMDIVEIIRTIDGSVAVAVLLFVGWRVEVVFSKILAERDHLIDKLTNGKKE